MGKCDIDQLPHISCPINFRCLIKFWRHHFNPRQKYGGVVAQSLPKENDAYNRVSGSSSNPFRLGRHVNVPKECINESDFGIQNEHPDQTN